MEQGILYCLTSPSNKKYIGQTKRKLQTRITEHVKTNSCRLLHHAIQKYGISNFTIEIVKACSIDELDKYETEYIEMFNTMYPYGYNIKSGGTNNSSHCEESRLKMSNSKKGVLNHNFGKPRSEQTKRKISNAKSGPNHHFYGKTLNENHVLKAAQGHRKNDSHRDLPMYMVYVKPRPEYYTGEGYAIMNHPYSSNKYFTSKKLSLEAKYQAAYSYLSSISNSK